MKYLTALFFCALFVPCLTFADVKINEVSWMGTAASQYSEWIELYNDGVSDISVAGWKIYKASNELLFTLTKTVTAGGYLLIERTTASAPDAVSGINDEAGTFSNGGLSNSGEDLVLKDDAGNAIDSILFANGWSAGDATTKDTMQRQGDQWITAPGTPDAPNATVANASTNTDSNNDPSSTSHDNTSENNSSMTTVSSSTSKQNPSSASVTVKKTIPATQTPAVLEPELSITVPKAIFQGVPISFETAFKNSDTVKKPQGYFYWNMGDGTTYTQSELSPIDHVYRYDGVYTMNLSYFDSLTATHPVLQAILPVTVLKPLLHLDIIDNGAAVQISNNTAEVMDIGQWPITTPEGTRALSPMTMVAAKSHITVTKELLGLTTLSDIKISTPDGVVVGK